jgi:predicted membrane protein
MSKKNLKNIFWGVFFLACAGLMFASATGNLIGVGFWSWVFTICFTASTISSLASLDVTGTVFSLAFLVIIWRSMLGIDTVSTWTILAVALLADIGLSMLLKPVLKRFKKKNHATIIINNKVIKVGGNKSHDQSASKATINTDADVTVDVKMGSATRYVQSSNFQHADINVNIGDAKIYFDQAQIVGDTAVIELNGSIGEVDLYFPSTWQVENQLNNFISDMNVHGQAATDGPTVVLTGTFKVGDVNIYYI